jgi:hypothetical protein
MRSSFAALGALLALSAPLSSQCSTLAVSGALNPGETVTIALGGATPDALTFLFAGQPGSTTIGFGALGGFTVGLAQPFIALPIGVTGSDGTLSLSVDVPADAPSFAAGSITLQAVTFEVVPAFPPFSFCVSNTATLSSGASEALTALRRWTGVMLDANALDHTPAGPGSTHTFGQQLGPCRTARAMAIVEVAIFETLIAIDGGYQSYVGLPPVAGNVSRPAAIAQAGRDTLAALYPSQAGLFDSALATDLAAIPSGSAKTAGIVLGSAAASAILAMRAADGSNHAEPLVNTEFVCSDQPGFWRQDLIVPHPLALGAHWAQVLPFVMTSASQFQAPAPPPLSGAAYADAYNEVKSLGGDGVITPTLRTTDQTWAGIFWGYDGMPGLGTPPRLYNKILLEIADQQGSSAMETARLLALANTAMADAGLAVWESKYFHQLWRPCSAIREADAGTGPTGLGDGNPGTAGDPTFTPLGAPVTQLTNVNFLTPPFPAYPSGHAGFGGAVFQTLRRFYGTDVLPFAFVSDELDGVRTDVYGNPRPLVPRSFQTLSQAEEENGQSRVYLGIHWVYDKTAGITQGNSVGNWVFDHMYQPAP